MPTTIALDRPVKLAPAPEISLATCFLVAWAAAMLLLAILAAHNLADTGPDPFEMMALF